MRVPTATYRLQLGPDLPFERAAQLVPFLDELGVSDVYVSPVFQARTGSTHGYDVVDPNRRSVVLGGDDGFARLSAALADRQLGLLLDIVPNHQAAHEENPRWRAVLQHGQHAVDARFFDIDWNPPWPGMEQRLLLPVLGRRYASVLGDGELRLGWDDTGFALHYYDRRFPLSRSSLGLVLRTMAETVPPNEAPMLRRALSRLEVQVDTGAVDPDAVSRQLVALLQTPEGRQALSATLALFDPRRGADAIQRLDRIVAAQHYRLVFWRSALRQLNYRRFFDIADLAGVRVDEPFVFEATHQLILEFVRSGQVTGLRIDHIDGLADPEAYLARLRRRLNEAVGVPEEQEPAVYIVVEKILTGDEALAPEWPVAGTTGYEFARQLTRLFLHPEGSARLAAAHARFVAAEPGEHGRMSLFSSIADRARRDVLAELFSAELDLLAARLARLAQSHPLGRDLTLDELRRAVFEVTAALPVYRTYLSERPIRPSDRAVLKRALAEAAQQWPDGEPALALLGHVFLSWEQRDRDWLAFVQRWQQLTGAAMAKGVEDTALYRDVRLLALNEVGCEPDDGPLTSEAFHDWCRQRLTSWPHGLSATSTHDTKRSEDARARLSVLADIPDTWDDAVTRWHQETSAFRPTVDGEPVPEPAMELLCYQSLLAAWPVDPAEEAGFLPRVQAYLIKAAREAKLRTSWISPSQAYEQALGQFVEALLTDPRAEPFRREFHRIRQVVAFHGALTSLAQVAVKLTAPGVPDIYQGCELWCLSLVDPDNRRPVDFERRARLLRELRSVSDADALASELLARWEDGRIKLYLTSQLLHLRRAAPELFARGDYVPLASEGPHAAAVVAFARRHGDRWAITVVSRSTARAVAWEDGLPSLRAPVGAPAWQDTLLRLPDDAPRRWRCHLTGNTVEVAPGRSPILPLADVFRQWPVSVLVDAAGHPPTGD